MLPLFIPILKPLTESSFAIISLRSETNNWLIARLSGSDRSKKVAADRHVGVLHTRGEHADSYLAWTGRRQGNVNYFNHVGIAEASDLNNPVARAHGPVPATRDPVLSRRNGGRSLRRIKFACDHMRCPLLAHSEHGRVHRTCLLSGAKRT
jgi:hypothetical protein